MPALAVGAIAAFAVATVTTVTLGTALAIGIATAVATHMVMKEMSYGSVANNVASSQALTVGKPKPVAIVGKTVVSGSIIKYDDPEHDNAQWHHFYLTIAIHPCESVNIYQIDGDRYSEMSGDGYYLEPRLGDQTGPTERSLQYMSNVDETFVGTNATDLYCEFVNDSEVWPSGVQDIKLLVQGVRVYDPRKDSTAGGSGGHRIDDTSTWEWTDNAALINFWWKMFQGSLVLPAEMFDMANIAYEANICDELVNVTDSSGNTSTEPRYTCNGTIDLTDGHESVEERLLSSCGGRWIESAGQYRLQVAAHRGPALFTITEQHLAKKPKRKPHRPLSERVNYIRGTFISKDAYYQDADMTPIESDELINNRDAGAIYEGDLQLHYTQTESMAQRLAVIELLRNAAGDTIELSLKRCYANIISGSVVHLDLPSHLIQGSYEVIDTKYDHVNRQFSMTVSETSSDIYNQLQTPPDFDVTPNFQLDNTYIAPVNNLKYTATPNDSFRQGVLTWQHQSAKSVKEYVLSIEKDGEVIAQRRTIEQYFNVVNLVVGQYTANVFAKNALGKPSEAISIVFNTEVPSTPTGSVSIDVLAGKVIITGPDLPNSAATYEWRYAFNESFETAFNAGLNTVLTVLNTPHNGTLQVWYRIVIGDVADPSWVAFSVPNLVGVSAEQIDPVAIANIQFSGFPQRLKDTLSGVMNDISLWSEQSGEHGENYSTLLYNVTEAVSASQANALEIIAVKQQIGDDSIEASVTSHFNAQIGYLDENGDFVAGPLAEVFTQANVTNLDGESISVVSYLQALETSLGDLEGTFTLGVVNDENGDFTGVEITDGTNSQSTITLFTDNLIWASRSGTVGYKYDANRDQHVWMGGSALIGANEMEVKNLSNPFGPDNLVYWCGPVTVDANGNPDYASLTKSNAAEWRDSTGNRYFGGSLSAGVLRTAAQNPTTEQTPSITIGPFGTNGNAKTIVVSYTLVAASTNPGQCPVSFMPSQCSITLERKIGTGDWETINIFTVNKTLTGNYESETGFCYVDETAEASFTHTDSTSSTDDFSYRATLGSQEFYSDTTTVSKQILAISSQE